MAKSKPESKLYRQMRDSGVRKGLAKELRALPSHAKDGKRAPKAMRDAVTRLEETVAELREHVKSGDRRAGARKAARTRGANADKRKAAARRGARNRTKK
jgi:hypothetical protein